MFSITKLHYFSNYSNQQAGQVGQAGAHVHEHVVMVEFVVVHVNAMVEAFVKVCCLLHYISIILSPCRSTYGHRSLSSAPVSSTLSMVGMVVWSLFETMWWRLSGLSSYMCWTTTGAKLVFLLENWEFDSHICSLRLAKRCFYYNLVKSFLTVCLSNCVYKL
jgi:hypothetical protein